MGGPWLLTLAVLGVSRPDLIAVSVSAPPQDPCAFVERIPQALARMLPFVEITELSRRAGGARRAVLYVAASADRVELELQVDGEVGALTRTLPNPREACAATADGVALIVDRHVRDLGWVPPPPARVDPPPAATATTPPARPPEPPPAGRREVATGTVADRSGGGDAPPPRRATTGTVATGTAAVPGAPRGGAAWPFSLGLYLAGEGELGSAPLHGAAGGRLGLWAGLGPLVLAVHGRVGTGGEASVSRLGRVRGALLVQSQRLGAQLGYALPLGPLRLLPELGLQMERVRGEVAGDRIFQQTPRTVWSPLIQGGLRAELPIVDRLGAYGAFDVAIRPVPLDFEVEGAEETPAYRASRLVVWLALGVWAKIL